ncbi:MAG TPA: aldose epimerase family protein [Trebonia sp.]|nr:aldose epimerase family protein [Trebonia sp.]
MRTNAQQRVTTRFRWPRRRAIWAGATTLAAGVLAAGSIAATSASAASAPAKAGNSGTISISKSYFGSTVEPYTGKETSTYEYTMSNADGMKVQLLSYGGIVRAIDVPGANGTTTDVVLGFQNLQDYVSQDSPPVTVNGGPYFGETVGRYANRLAKGTFALKQPDGQTETYTVPVNNGGNSLHGGVVGFGQHVWSQAALIRTSDEAGVTLQLVSPNGDDGYPAGSTAEGCPNGCTGFPAQVTTDVTYTLNNNNQFEIHYSAHNDSYYGANNPNNLNTVINLTNHSYFNLDGAASPPGSAYSQKVQINANTYSPDDATEIPLGPSESVKGTPFDFTTPQTVGSRIDDVSMPENVPSSYNSETDGESQLAIAEGYDFNWVLNKQTEATTGPDGLNLAAHAWDPSSGREMTVWTDQPGVQFYSGNFLTGTLTGGIDGTTYRQGAGYTFETQHFPNSPNEPSYPSTELDAGQTFTTSTVFAFSW